MTIDGTGPKIQFERTINIGSLVTIGTMIVGALVPFFTLRGDVEALSVRIETGVAESERLRQGVDKINDLIIVRTPERYTKADAGIDRDIYTRHFEALEAQITALQQSRTVQDHIIEQLNHTLETTTLTLQRLAEPRR